jgi:hypothetical protein
MKRVLGMFIITALIFTLGCSNTSETTNTTSAASCIDSPGSAIDSYSTKDSSTMSNTSAAAPSLQIKQNADITKSSAGKPIKSSDNVFFFKKNISEVSYKGKFLFNDFVEADIKLLINEVKGLKHGKLYELKLSSIKEIPEDRLCVGYFYVQKDRIYKIEPTKENLEKLKSSEILPKNSTIVCQDKEIKDTLGKDEAGWHYSIEVIGDKIEYHSYNNLVSTGYYEAFTWQKGKGLVSYRSGFGAERDSIELNLH